jgi:hypothetical protein
MKNVDIVIIIGRLFGICILDLFFFEVFAFLAIKRIIIPVVPPEIVPLIPKIDVKLIS